MRTSAAHSLLCSLPHALVGRHRPLPRAILLALLSVAALWLMLERATPALAAGVVINCASDTDLRTKLAGGGLVTFNCNGTGSSAIITVTSPLTLTTGQVKLDGGGQITLSGANAHRIFFLNGIGSLSFTLTHIVLTRGYDVNAGGCLYAAADRVLLDDVTVQQCGTASAGEGGGISNLFSDFHLDNSRVLSNAAGTGGGIASASAAISLTNSLIAANLAITGTGGGLDVRNGSAFITGTTLSLNGAFFSGGGIHIRPTGRATVVNSRLEGNMLTSFANISVTQGGGGIFNGNRLVVSDTVVSGNRATFRGGGIDNRGTATLNRVTFSGNMAGVGGGLQNLGGTAILSDVAIIGNIAGSAGGGVYNVNGSASLSNVTLRGNSGSFGGGIHNTGGSITLTQVMLSGNEAEHGGGIDNQFASATLTNVTLSGNTALQEGGGLLNASGGVTLTHVTLYGNAASTGGGIAQGGGAMRLKSSIVADSIASSNCFITGGTFFSDDYNLSDDDSCIPLFTQGHDLNQTPALLGPLANNGGPTLTHLPLASSPAVDAIPVGVNGCGTQILNDQRGVARPQGNAKCDLGAVERIPGERTPLLWLPLILR